MTLYCLLDIKTVLRAWCITSRGGFQCLIFYVLDVSDVITVFFMLFQWNNCLKGSVSGHITSFWFCRKETQNKLSVGKKHIRLKNPDFKLF